ncbi:MAG: hypothetical protein ABI206_12615, partial [Antricoccus sp.]
ICTDDKFVPRSREPGYSFSFPLVQLGGVDGRDNSAAFVESLPYESLAVISERRIARYSAIVPGNYDIPGEFRIIK